MVFGRKETDEKLIALEKQMAREYSQAYSEMRAKADKYFKKFKEADKQKERDMYAGKITKSEYREWRRNKMLTGEQYKSMVRNLSNEMTITNQKVTSMIRGHMLDTFADNANYAGYEVCRKTTDNLPFTLFDKKVVERLVKENPRLLPKPRVNISKDRAWNRRKMNSALTQGILQGESVDKIAKRLQSVTDMNQRSAIRNARTMTTSAENAGRLERYKEASALGIDMMKKWVAVLDHVTRDSHVDVDGEVQELDHPFSNGLDYPGAVGPPEEVYNCRCSMESEIKGVKYADNRYSKLGNMSYADWKAQHAVHRVAVEERRQRRNGK